MAPFARLPAVRDVCPGMGWCRPWPGWPGLWPHTRLPRGSPP